MASHFRISGPGFKTCGISKFELFYPDTKSFEQQIDVELCRDEPNWQTLLSESTDNARLIMNRLSPKLGHVALTTFSGPTALAPIF